MIVFLNGSYLSLDQARISPLDRGFLLGDGVFETLYVNHGYIECLKAHGTLLRYNATVLRIPFKEKDETLEHIIDQLIKMNDLSQDTAAVRITVTRGESGRGLLPVIDCKPTLLITAVPYQRPREPLKVMIARDRIARSRLSSIKHLGYQEAILARLEAQDSGFHDAIVFNDKDELVKGTVANVFVFFEGKWITPPIHNGARPGVVRGRLLQKGLAEVKKISLSEILSSAQAMVFTNSLIGIQPVQMLQDRFLDLTQALALQDQFFS